MLRKGSPGKSGEGDVRGAMKFIEPYVALTDPDWEALEDYKRYTKDDVDMGEPREEGVQSLMSRARKPKALSRGRLRRRRDLGRKARSTRSRRRGRREQARPATLTMST